MAGTRKIDPVLLAVAVDVRVMSRSSPKPAKSCMMKPELRGRNAGNINPAQFLVVDPREMAVPEIPKPVLLLPRRRARVDHGGFLPDEVEPGGIAIVIEDGFDSLGNWHAGQALNIRILYGVCIFSPQQLSQGGHLVGALSKRLRIDYVGNVVDRHLLSQFGHELHCTLTGYIGVVGKRV